MGKKIAVISLKFKLSIKVKIKTDFNTVLAVLQLHTPHL